MKLAICTVRCLKAFKEITCHSAMEAKDLVQCALQIEKRLSAGGSYSDLLTLLGDLEKMHVTAEHLETTDVARVLYRLLKVCRDHAVKKQARFLLSRWKRLYSEQGRGVKAREAEDGGVSREGASQSALKASDEEGSSSASKTAPSEASSVRSKCVQLLLAALRPKPPDEERAAHLAEDIERHVHERHGSSLPKHKACVRSKVANLRNPNSQHLRQGLLSGTLAPETFAAMSPEEMAGEELRQLRGEYTSRGVSERQLPQGPEGTPTSKLRCQKCDSSDCRVTQVSRGALFLPAWVRPGGPDEDAMTFVTCSSCGQQWYHSGWVCL